MKIELFPDLLVRACTHPSEWIARLRCPGSAARLDQALTLETRLDELRGPLKDWLHLAVAGADKNARSALLELKRRISAGYDPLPAQTAADSEPRLQEWRRLAQERQSILTEAQKLFREELETARARLAELFADPGIVESVRLSSERLYQGVLRYRARPPRPGEPVSKAQRQLERSLAEYLARATFDSTPRGLLASVGACLWDSQASYPQVEAGLGVKRRRTLLNLKVARRLAAQISGDGDTWTEIVPRLNPTFHRKEGKIQFWVRKAQGESLLALPEGDELIESFVGHAAARKLRASELILAVAGEFEDAGASLEQLTEFYHSLCGKGLLIGQLEIPFEEQDGLAFLHRWLEEHPGSRTPVREQVNRAWEIVRQLDDAVGAHANQALYTELMAMLGESELQDCVVVDSVSALDGARLPEEVRELVLQSIRTEAAPASAVEAPGSAELAMDARPLMDLHQSPPSAREPRHAPGDSRYGWGFVAFVLENGGISVRRVSGGVGTFPRFTALFGPTEDRNPLLRLLRKVSEWRHRCYPGQPMVEMLVSPASKLATAAWFPSVEKQAIEAPGVRSSRDASQLIPLGELSLSGGPSGLSLLWRGQSLRIVRDQPISSQIYPWLRMVPTASSPAVLSDPGAPRSGTRKWECPAPELPGGPSDDSWEVFLRLRRWARSHELPELARVSIWIDGAWTLYGAMDFRNPFLAQSLWSTFSILQPKGGKLLLKATEISPPEGAGYHHEFHAPFFIS